MKVHIDLVSNCHFIGKNQFQNEIQMDGPPDIGGQNKGCRPMEVVLFGLAGCSSIDVVHILQKGHQTLIEYSVEVEAERADAIPAVFSKIHLIFKGKGAFAKNKFERAVALSLEKYCSVSKMLESTVTITSECQFEEVQN